MALKFSERLSQALAATDSLVCVGLDPDLARLPEDLRSDPQPLLAFNRRIVDATADLCAAYKPQIAFYSALGKESSSPPASVTSASALPQRWSSWTPSAATSATRLKPTRARRSTDTMPTRSR